MRRQPLQRYVFVRSRFKRFTGSSDEGSTEVTMVVGPCGALRSYSASSFAQYLRRLMVISIFLPRRTAH